MTQFSLLFKGQLVANFHSDDLGWDDKRILCALNHSENFRFERAVKDVLPPRPKDNLLEAAEEIVSSGKIHGEIGRQAKDRVLRS